MNAIIDLHLINFAHSYEVTQTIFEVRLAVRLAGDDSSTSNAGCPK